MFQRLRDRLRDRYWQKCSYCPLYHIQTGFPNKRLFLTLISELPFSRPIRYDPGVRGIRSRIWGLILKQKANCGAWRGGFAILVSLMVLAACQPTPTPTPAASTP